MIWILFVGTMALSLWAMWRVKSVYARYSQGVVRSGLTGGELADEILRRTGIRDVEITMSEGMLGDHYDPIHKRLVLSPDNYHGRSPAALGVAAYECGHAIQYSRAHAPLHWRMAAVGITTYANYVVMFLPLLGLFTGLVTPLTGALFMAVAWGIIMLFNLVTPGPDVFAETRDHTLRAAFAKAMTQLREQITSRAAKRLHRLKSNVKARRDG